MEVSRADRAKQFMPFDALKGLRDALREKEIEFEDKKELLEDSLTELENTFNRIKKGSNVKIRYYKGKRYIDEIGTIIDIDYGRKNIKLNNNEKINLSDITRIVME